jgi:hypothetical protein
MHYVKSRKVVGTIPDEVIGFSLIYLSLSAALGPGAYSASNRNEHQTQKKMFLVSSARSAFKAKNFTANFEPTV